MNYRNLSNTEMVRQMEVDAVNPEIVERFAKLVHDEEVVDLLSSKSALLDEYRYAEDLEDLGVVVREMFQVLADHRIDSLKELGNKLTTYDKFFDIARDMPTDSFLELAKLVSSTQ